MNILPEGNFNYAAAPRAFDTCLSSFSAARRPTGIRVELVPTSFCKDAGITWTSLDALLHDCPSLPPFLRMRGNQWKWYKGNERIVLFDVAPVLLALFGWAADLLQPARRRSGTGFLMP